MRNAWLLLFCLLLPATARATSFVYDAGAAVAIPKSDYQANPSIPSNQKIVAGDWNQLGQAAYDLRQGITWGYYHGLSGLSSTPPAPGCAANTDGVRFFNEADGGQLFMQDCDGGTTQIATTANTGITGATAGDVVFASSGTTMTTDHANLVWNTANKHLILGGNTDDGSGAVLQVPLGSIKAIGILSSVFNGTGVASTFVNSAALDGASAVGMVINTNSFVTSGAKLLSVRNSGSPRLEVDKDGKLLAPGPITLDATVAGHVASFVDSIGLTRLTVGDNATDHYILDTPGSFVVQSDSASNALSFQFNTSATHTSGDLLDVANNGTIEFAVSSAGVVKGVGGFNSNSQKVINVLAGTSSTDGVNVSQLSNYIAGQVSGFYPATSAFAFRTAPIASSSQKICAYLLAGATSTGGSNVTMEIYNTTTSTSVCSVSIPSCGTSGAPLSAGTNNCATCAGSIAAGDSVVLRIQGLSSCSSGNGSFNVNAQF